jgi:hypothetical protein
MPDVQSQTIPYDLVRDIRAGRCAAFVGAGFSGAAKLPAWRDLLQDIAGHERIPEKEREYIRGRLDSQRADHNEEAAQLLSDRLGREHFIAEVKERLSGRELTSTMKRRLELLNGIPFRTVLTTNFDDILSGDLPSREVFGRILQGYTDRSSSWPDASHWTEFANRSPTVVKLHGDLAKPESVVFSRLDYRRHLYDDPAYLGFLKSVFLYNTVLYLGFSFTDAYINDLRSQALALLGNAWQKKPPAYAVMNDVPELTIDHFEKHEGIRFLSYDTAGGTDFSGFDRILEAIFKRTSPVVQFGKLLEGKRILWVDPHPENNTPATDGLLVDAAREAGHPGAEVVSVPSAEDALDVLRRMDHDRESVDLVITHWGRVEHTAEQLLGAIRTSDLRVPLIVFAGYENGEVRKRVALALGAQGYYHSWEGLRRGIEQVFGYGPEHF